MKYAMIFLSVLAVLLPIIMIVEQLIGANWITYREFFYMMFAYLILIAIYFGNKKKEKAAKEQAEKDH